jgi:monoamine oxidase
LPAERVAVHFGTIVRAVTWSKGRVTVDAERRGESVRFHAPRAIVTLPLSILQLPSASPHSVRFTPDLGSKRTALTHLAFGPVIKVVMHFARPFWAELHDARYRDAAFFFAPKAAFPAFWTSLPVRSSLLVAWCAGSRVEKLAGKSEGEIVASVKESLRELFGRRNYSALLEGVFWHDWQGDPFSCGAYSYVVAQGAGARRSLARPMQDTLYFAGEACDAHGEAATVGGALRSGIRASREVLG